MEEATAKFAKQLSAGGFFAEVTVQVDGGARECSVVVACDGEGFRSQGSMETVPAKGYDDWKSGAVLGVQFALNAARLTAAVRIIRISGMSADTNSSIVAAASALAVWKALHVQPPPEALVRIEEVALTSWGHSPVALERVR